MSFIIDFTEKRAWRKCPEDGNVFQRAGVYTLEGIKYFAFQCPRCSKVVLTDQRIEDPQGG